MVGQRAAQAVRQLTGRHAPKKHSPECRARFEKLLAEEPASLR